MKKLLLLSLFFALAIVVPMPTMAGGDMHAGISLPPHIAFEAPPEVMTPDTSGAYVVADAAADTPKDSPTGRDEKQQDQSLEKGKSSGSEGKSDWKINVWPVQPPDNVKSLPQMKDENKHTPPDRL
ncbi:MAG: hypothetical protein FIA94_04380 [Nitrospirae bacterium]|nr:hypothetical protein [Nitrospirota bacterium]